MKQSSNKSQVTCKNCIHLTFSDCYCECGAGYRGIVQPDDSCEYGKPKQPKRIKSHIVVDTNNESTQKPNKPLPAPTLSCVSRKHFVTDTTFKCQKQHTFMENCTDKECCATITTQTLLKYVKRGETFSHCGREWLVLEHDDAGNTLVLSQDIIGQMPFDTTSNNWATSSLRTYLVTDFLDSLCFYDNVATKNRANAFDLGFRLYALDLTANDGKKDYGQAFDCVFLLTCDLYRKHRDIIPPIDKQWWLATAVTTDQPVFSLGVHIVHDRFNGMIFSTNANSEFGVRPACYLNSNTPIFVKENSN